MLTLYLLAALTATLAGAKPLQTRATPCFIIGSQTLPSDVETVVESLTPIITCSSTSTTLSNVPDVTSSNITYSSIDFSTSSLTPLAFALQNFATATPLASTDLTLFQNNLNVYLATEAGIRSVGGDLKIKVPKFFLSFQIARINAANGVVVTNGETVDHLLGKVLKNAGSAETQADLDAVTALSTILS